MSLFLLSLAGLPPTCGFFGKLFLIQALTGMNSPLVWLIVLFALTSVVCSTTTWGRSRRCIWSLPAKRSWDTVQSADGLKLALA